MTRSGVTIDVIKYLAKLDWFAYVDSKNKTLKIIKQFDLQEIQTYKARKVVNFCLNEEVYRESAASRSMSNWD